MKCVFHFTRVVGPRVFLNDLAALARSYSTMIDRSMKALGDVRACKSKRVVALLGKS